MVCLTSKPARYGLGISLVLLNLYDLFITRAIISNGGKESNPIMAGVIESHWGLLVKLLIPGVVAYLAVKSDGPKIAPNALFYLAIYYLIICVWNTHVYLKGMA
jgi:hypothetical protein